MSRLSKLITALIIVAVIYITILSFRVHIILGIALFSLLLNLVRYRLIYHWEGIRDNTNIFSKSGKIIIQDCNEKIDLLRFQKRAYFKK